MKAALFLLISTLVLGAESSDDCNTPVDDWLPSTRQYCCKTMGRGCPDQPYDCQAGEANWVKGWSGDKKNWCCNHHNRGCYDCREADTNWILDWSPSKKEWCCNVQDINCYDCEAGKDNWRVGWSVGKKEWCCKQTGMSCFDCSIGYDNWAYGWSEDKKRWCCKHENLGCGGSDVGDVYGITTSTTKTTTTTTKTTTTTTTTTTTITTKPASTTRTSAATTVSAASTATTSAATTTSTATTTPDAKQLLADAQAEEECNTSIFRVGYQIAAHVCTGSSGNTSNEDVPSAAACAKRAMNEGCGYFVWVNDSRICNFRNNSYNGSEYAKDNAKRTSGPSDCRKAYRNETLDGDYYQVVTNKAQFLEECSEVLAPAACVDVAPGSIILTVGGASQDVVDKAVSEIEKAGLKLPSFGTLKEASLKRSKVGKKGKKLMARTR